MIIREASDRDIPAIVDLLKLSLGEGLMPKSAAFWHWKHLDNPFGKSLVFLGLEGDLLVGVRAFMRWEWHQGSRVFKAVRAVDTATHPDFQGKGVFRELTLRCVEACRSEKIDFVFNTPNEKSKPGYLKMGWGSNGRMKLYMIPRIPRRSKSTDFDSTYSMQKASFQIDDRIMGFHKEWITTTTSEKMLAWRYRDNPNIQYYYVADDQLSPSFLTIFRLKPRPFGFEFRICDTLWASEQATEAYKKLLEAAIARSGAAIVTTSVSLGMFPTLSARLGPEITTLPLSFGRDILTSDSWRPSLGDMEVF